MERIGLTPRVARVVGVVGLFAVLTVVHTWPLAYATSRRVQRGADVVPGMWALTELGTRLLEDPVNLMDGRIFYPFRHTLAVIDHQIANALLAVPLIATGAGPAQTYNLVVLLSFVLSGVCTWLLVRRLTGSTGAGLVAGSIFAFGSYRAGHLLQSHLLPTQWLPLALLALDHYLARPTWIRWGALLAATLLVALSSWHLAVIGAVGIGLVAVWRLAARPAGWPRALGGLVLVGAMAALLLLPLARIYAAFGSQWPPLTADGRETVETLTGLSVNLQGIVTPPDNVRAPWAPMLAFPDLRGPGIFPGFVALGLAVAALAGFRSSGLWSRQDRVVRSLLLLTTGLVLTMTAAALSGPAGAPVVAWLRPLAPFALFGVALTVATLVLMRRLGPARDDRPATVTYAALAAIGLLLALGPRVMAGTVDLGSGLWRFDLLPVQLIIRAPERLSLLFGLGIAALAGIGFARLAGRAGRRGRVVLAGLALLAVNGELAFSISDLRDAPAPTAADEWLAASPEPGAVVDYPLRWDNTGALTASQFHGRRVVNGTGYLIPSPFITLDNEPDFSPGQLDVLWAWFRPRFVVVRTGLYPEGERADVMARVHGRPDALIPRGEFGGDDVFELIDRGRGPVLYRHWPAHQVWPRSALVFDASVSSGRADTLGGLSVTLNGRLLFDTFGPAALVPTTHRVAFRPEDLTGGINTFAIHADYRFTPGAARHPIGATGSGLAADVTIDADRLRSTVRVNGRELPVDRGYLLVVLDAASGAVTDLGQFDVSSGAGAADRLVAFVAAIPDGAPVVVASEFDVSRLMTDEAVTALGTLGLDTDLRGRFQVQHAAVGLKGADPGTALEVIDRLHARLDVGRPDRRDVQLDGLRLE